MVNTILMLFHNSVLNHDYSVLFLNYFFFPSSIYMSCGRFLLPTEFPVLTIGTFAFRANRCLRTCFRAHYPHNMKESHQEKLSYMLGLLSLEITTLVDFCVCQAVNELHAVVSAEDHRLEQRQRNIWRNSS